MVIAAKHIVICPIRRFIVALLVEKLKENESPITTRQFNEALL